MTTEKAKSAFANWFREKNGYLPTSQTKLLVNANRIRALRAQLQELETGYAMDLRATELYEAQQQAFLAAMGVDE